MKISCSVCVVNRVMPALPAHLRKKASKSTLALCRHPKNFEYCLILFSAQNKNSTKYSINGNIDKVLTKFVNEGKCTIQLKKPEHDICIQADSIQLKGFLHLLKRVLNGYVLSKELTLSSLSVTPIKPKDIAPTKLTITARSEYPSKGFPRTLEYLYINSIKRCGLDVGILQLMKLKVLNLSDNQIEYLPEELSNLPNLKELNMAHNQLGKGTIKQWSWIGGYLSKNLVLLDLSYNELTFVPEQLIKLQNLFSLHLSHNKLQKLPCGLGNLRSLRIFSASNNKFLSLPEGVPFREHGIPKALNVGSLKEYAGKKVLWARLPYPKGSIPLTLIEFLDYAKYCVCGKACFSLFLRNTHSMPLNYISETISVGATDTIYAPVDCYYCSLKCYNTSFHNRPRYAIVR
ncbi:hypothetical protein GWI33_013727 [Rhynchophorus ferrugineus]|uniref:PIF1/LRR1 pleckstrin homology domain-containing protein n=1 Tax=Rhynchophorus ferrugineus TaxID=354439 RepID=A0A834I8W6_RHYFE|nr:hypothetical protein GWI33_013727 [Rhynchophorus ferrugineus]